VECDTTTVVVVVVGPFDSVIVYVVSETLPVEGAPPDVKVVVKDGTGNPVQDPVFVSMTVLVTTSVTT
jgi:hypothetical protein